MKRSALTGTSVALTVATGAVVGVAAWTRGQEKITRITNVGRYDDDEEEKTVERSTTSQKPVG